MQVFFQLKYTELNLLDIHLFFDGCHILHTLVILLFCMCKF